MRRGAPGDAPSMASLAISWERQQLSKKRSQYFSDIFAARELRYTPKERVTRDAIIIAELKISSTLDRDTSIVSDFSFHLAQTYQRPESCILLTIQNSTLLVLGGSYEPAYLLSITALQCDIAPRINKRMTGLVQGFLQDSLNIPAKRGVIRFMPIAEENLGTNGMTTLGEIEELVKADHHDPSIRRTISNNRIRRAKKKSLSTIFHGPKIPLLLTPPRSKEDDDDTMVPPYPVATTERKSVKKRRSFLAFFGKSS
ncbi:putative mif domain-containing protein [Phaeomoniella chlamydospora]|uniref:L-dopachrome isomerase n=1 Tax=Phaeomoniella chlamydospora TaxID=158046 RepID=A0A0G2HLH6_PHACM|nr:putative mif domain-containing protein [Phaeomoniella chlamydospora]